MALIQCPNCGGMISNKARSCVKCGFRLENEKITMQRRCEDCGSVIPEEAKACPVCGCPVSNEAENEELEKTLVSENTDSQSLEITQTPIPSKRKRRGKRLPVLIGIVVFLLVAGFVAFRVYSIGKIKEYKQDYSNCLTWMLIGAADAEDAAGLIHDVWYNTIRKAANKETDKYTKNSYGEFYGDFNDSIANLYSDSDFADEIDSINNNQDIVNKYMKKLTSPPKSMEAAYDAINNLYEAYNRLVACATNPSGSLLMFTETTNSADSDFMNRYYAAKLYVDE